MTFTRTVKNELITVPVKTTEMLAEFSAFLNLACDFIISNNMHVIEFPTTSATVSRRFLSLAKSLYQAETVLITKERETAINKKTIILRLTTKIEEIISEHGYLEDRIDQAKLIAQSEDAKKAFLRASFLISGSVNHPKTAEYHLEIFAKNSEEIIFIQSLMNHFNLNAKIIKRRNGYIVYLKNADSISDFLQLIGAQNALFEFEDNRIRRDFNNSINRIMNIEIANEKKSYEAAVKQFNNIKLIESYRLNNEVDDKMLEVINLRKKYPEASLQDLTFHYQEEYGETISRSGLNHRFNKIEKLANKIREISNDN